MPRRTGAAAETAASKTREAQWRYLLRNPDFRDDVNDLLRTYDLVREEIRKQTLERGLGRGFGPPLNDLEAQASQLEEKLAALATPRGFVFPVRELRLGLRPNGSSSGDKLPNLTADTLAVYERLICGASPVSVHEDYDGKHCIGPDELGNPHKLYLEVDLTLPRDVLLALIEKKLNEVVEKRSSILKRDERKRQRFDKADFKIAVFDRAVEGELFRAIAASLGRPVSTVKSAYLPHAERSLGRPARAASGTCRC